LQRALDHFDHGIKLLQDFGVPKAKDLIPLALEALGPSPILLRHRGMLTSIELHNALTLYATEIGDKRWKRIVTAKFGPSALPPA